MLLESMKKGIGKYVMIVLASLLILSFAVWGIGDMAGVISNPDEIAIVGETKITQREFQDQFRREMERIRSRVGNINAEQARNIGLADTALNSLIAKRLILLQATALGILISDDQVVRRIKKEPTFRNEMGQFDRVVFQTTLANNGLSENMYVASLREETQQEYIGGAITAGVEAPPTLVNKVYQFRNERRTADIIKIKRSLAGKPPSPKEVQLVEFLNKNSAQFMAPEYRRLSILHLDPVEVAKELSPSEDDIQTEYEDRLASLSVPERRQLEQILLQDEEASKRAYSSLNEGRSFLSVATEFSEKPIEKTKLGLVARRDMLPMLADAVFALKKNQFTKPQKSPMGWHIIRVAEIEPGREPKLEEVRKQISDDLALDLALDDLVKRANQLEDSLAGGGSIDDAANDIGVKVLKTALIDSSGMSQTKKKQNGIPLEESFTQTAFSLKKGETSNLIETSNGGYFMVRVDDIVEAVKRAMDEVRPEVQAAWKADWLNKSIRKTAEEIRASVKGGTPLASAVSGKNLTVEVSKPVSRFSSLSGNLIPPSLLHEMFNAKVGDLLIGPISDGYAVVRVKGIQAASLANSDSDLKDLKGALSIAIANDVLQEYSRALREEYPVVMNQAALDAYFSNQDYGRR
ncbi:MAG: Peptidyl-prolyl cis-trans isomerase D [Alphaproteobacteria bacterium MarineAlpha11_Bin1]|nr:MAG: Peptidyl-prolyl cis-trans isomerase D [Alphaproteobacteria bacterium MarineAlpha11_Bin1]|tara:strand:- start:10938 stop:12845 length:1908 start_codon:yes stop_codon:yes gene_type:complete